MRDCTFETAANFRLDVHQNKGTSKRLREWVRERERESRRESELNCSFSD